MADSFVFQIDWTTVAAVVIRLSASVMAVLVYLNSRPCLPVYLNSRPCPPAASRLWRNKPPALSCAITADRPLRMSISRRSPVAIGRQVVQQRRGAAETANIAKLPEFLRKSSEHDI
jgi:hypothetical protein